MSSSVWRSLLPPLVVRGLAAVKHRVVPPPTEPAQVIPWSPYYHQRKQRVLIESLNAPALIDRFRHGTRLPSRYGVGIDERCIEYPWLVSQLPEGQAALLDAGSTLNHEYLLTLPVLREKKTTILTLSPEAKCFWTLGVSYLFHDLRDIPVRDAYFDTIACISTIEHVGFDNSFYTGSSRSDVVSGDFRSALGELNRVLKRGGTLFLTVPFGRHQQFSEFQQFDRKLLCEAVASFGAATAVVERFYRYSAEGWQLSDAAECADCSFVEWLTMPRDRWPDPPPAEPDLAAAARAVACVRITKA